MSSSEEMKPSTKKLLDLTLAAASGLFIGAMFASAFGSDGKPPVETISQATETTTADGFVVQGVALPPLPPSQSGVSQRKAPTQKPAAQAKTPAQPTEQEQEPAPFRPHPPFNRPKPISDPDLGSLEESVFNSGESK